jgi:hypothetical protein
MDEPGQSDEKALLVEGHGCVFGRQVVFGYPPETQTQVQFRVPTKSGELHLQCSEALPLISGSRHGGIS